MARQDKTCPVCNARFTYYGKPEQRHTCSRPCFVRFYNSSANTKVKTGRKSLPRFEQQCPTCKSIFKVREGVTKVYCSEDCHDTRTIRKPEFRMRTEGNAGYFVLYVDGVYLPEHRVVMMGELGRVLRSDELVHHENRMKCDNRPENLRVMTKSQHNIEHHAEKVAAGFKPPTKDMRKRVQITCDGCREKFLRLESQYLYQPNRWNFCSRQCYKENYGRVLQ